MGNGIRTRELLRDRQTDILVSIALWWVASQKGAVFAETNLVKTGLLTRSGSPGRLTLCSDPEGTLSNQHEGGQNGCSIFAIFEIKKKNLG